MTTNIFHVNDIKLPQRTPGEWMDDFNFTITDLVSSAVIFPRKDNDVIRIHRVPGV